MTDYAAFFQAAAKNLPYGWQQRLAGNCACQSLLINIPTGLGKTAGVVLAWLWNRVGKEEGRGKSQEGWPRRLVYCLPMRTLVEQTEREVRGWVENLAANRLIPANHFEGKPRVVVLMGGEPLEGDEKDWDIHPEQNAILIGTQDMLLSRALNRGYGMSRYRWPMHFGLLNNDCLWVMDEVQLMGAGLSTASQLEAFRSKAPQGLGSWIGNLSATWYLSATSNPDHLITRDWHNLSRPEGFVIGLTPDEIADTSGPIAQRRSATKKLEIRKNQTFADEAGAKTLVKEIVAQHQRMSDALASNPEIPVRTIIICNTVDRAKDIHRLLAAENPQGCDLLLLHSRFRPPERCGQMKRITAPAIAESPLGQIVVSTQVIEAGVDISSGLLWSEVAPLAPLVQRLGRLNRSGEFNNTKWTPQAVILELGLAPAPHRDGAAAKEKRDKENAKLCLPYALATCDPDSEQSSWKFLEKLAADASPANLETIQAEIADSIPRCAYSLQRHELLDFFDTDANLSLGFTDVSPFVRGLDDDTDLQVLWRESWLQKDGEEGTSEPGFTPDFQRDELCSVPLSKAKDAKAREVLNHGWLWRGKDSGWVSVRDAGLAPGMTILLPLDAGGYDEKIGWTGDKGDQSHRPHFVPREMPSDEEQLSSLANGWQSIAAHTRCVEEGLRGLLSHLLLNEESERNALTLAAPWHDIGKNHPGWQDAIISALEMAQIPVKECYQPYAKFSLSDSPQVRNPDGSAKLTGKQLYTVLSKLSRHFRPETTHEVASALAFRQAEQTRLGSARDTDLPSLLTEYVIMSHHGRVRKVLRDEIPTFPKSEKEINVVRGVADGSAIPQVPEHNLGCASLSIECRKMGREVRQDGTFGHESYTRGVLRLLKHYGPFRLTYFEAIFRAADVRASILAKRKA
jgi:CRISPR-associated endonuclease/helicase Cas3